MCGLRSSHLTGRQVLTNHQCHLENDGVVKLTQVKTGELFNFFQTVHQRVPVDKQFSRSFGNIQIILKELIDGEQRFLVQRVDGIFLEHLGKEYLAKGGG